MIPSQIKTIQFIYSFPNKTTHNPPSVYYQTNDIDQITHLSKVVPTSQQSTKLYRDNLCPLLFPSDLKLEHNPNQYPTNLLRIESIYHMTSKTTQQQDVPVTEANTPSFHVYDQADLTRCSFANQTLPTSDAIRFPSTISFYLFNNKIILTSLSINPINNFNYHLLFPTFINSDM